MAALLFRQLRCQHFSLHGQLLARLRLFCQHLFSFAKRLLQRLPLGRTLVEDGAGHIQLPPHDQPRDDCADSSAKDYA